MELNEILQVALRAGASDIHLKAGLPPMFRVDGSLVPLKDARRLPPEEIARMAFAIMNEYQKEKFKQTNEVDLAYGVPGLGRFRVNIFQQRGTIGVVLRVIPFKIQSIEQLMLPTILEKVAGEQRGLVLVTGTTGSGKSTTLAAMIDHINATETCHIMTIEDPIEFLVRDKRSIVNQREVGLDTKSYARALRGVVRAAPDVILIGEIRDKDGMEAAINLAGTGHLVLATLHANNCAESLDRIINMFPREQHNQIFLDLSQYLRAIMAQRLVMGKDTRRLAAVEIMINTPHIATLIKKGDVVSIKEAINLSGDKGIQSFDAALHELYKKGRISLEEALLHADSRANLEAKINFG